MATTAPAESLTPAQAVPAITRFTATTWAATSSDPSRAPYKVERRDDGAMTCTCDGNAVWGKVCRHIKAVEAQFPVPAPAVRRAPRPFMCLTCGQVPALACGLDCARCHRQRIEEQQGNLIRDWELMTGQVHPSRLEQAAVAAEADRRHEARERRALEDAASHRPLRMGHGWN